MRDSVVTTARRALIMMLAVCPFAAPTAAQTSSWVAQDIGVPALSGSATVPAGLTSGSFTIEAAGTDISGPSDQFHFVHQVVSRDVEIVARIDGLTPVNPWTIAGIMVRGSRAANAPHAFAGVTPDKGVYFRSRAQSGAHTAQSSGPGHTAPTWLRLIRQGSVVRGFASKDGVAWTSVGSASVTLGETVYVGLAVTSRHHRNRTTAVASNVTIGSIALPSGLHSIDIGSPATPGDVVASSDRYNITVSGTGIDSTADQAHLVYQPVTGNVEVIARVLSINASIPTARGGITVRESLAGESRHATVALSRGNGYAFQRRSDPAGDTVLTDGGAGTAPGWVRLARTGDLFVAYRSTDGRSWTRIGEEIIPMAETVYVGLVASSGSATAPVTAAIDSLSIKVKAGAGNRPPVVSVLSPASGTEVMLPATVTISALASDPENRLLSVDFYADWTLISRVTTTPYSLSWTPPAAGTYTLTAVAHDADGGSTTSSAVIVHAQPRAGTPAAVNVSTNATTAPPRASLSTPPVSGSTTVPASAKTTTQASASTAKPAGASTATPVSASTMKAAIDSTTTGAPASTATPGPASSTTPAAASSTASTPASTTTPASVSMITTGAVVTATGQPAANKPPLVALTTYGTKFTAPATIRLTAMAADPDGQVARVEFFSGTVRVHTDTTAPYTFAWSNVAAGTYSLTAVAFDNDGAGATSGQVILTVQKAPGAQADLSEITTRAHSPEPAPIEPVASALEWEDAIERVEFSSGATQPATATGAADELAWADLTTGPHTPAAIPVPNESAPATPTRAIARVRKGPNTPPVVSLTTDGTEFTAPARIVLTAVAWDAEGQVARVELFAGKTRLSTVTSEPYTFTWSSVRAGSYDLTAVAYDLEGARATSLPVPVSVQPALPVITLTTSGTTFSAPATMRLTAGITGSAAQPDRVEFFAGNTRLGTTVEAPHTFDWSDAAAGTYALTAVAVFDGDLTVTSAPVRVTVQPARGESNAVGETTNGTSATAR